MKRNLGGDRLGSGAKMDVELHGYGRSTHDLGKLWRSTMSAGTLVPFMSEVALPGDTFDIDLDVDVKTHPTVGPLFGSYKVQLDVFSCPFRLYQGLLHNNKLGIGMKMNEVKLPQVELYARKLPPELNSEGIDIDNFQINPSCIFSYLGIRGVGLNTTDEDTITRQFNAIPFLAYWDIYKNYYANKQETWGAVIHNVAETVSQDVDEITLGSGGDIVELPENVTTPTIFVLSYDAPLRIEFTGTMNPEWIYLLTLSGAYNAKDLYENWTDGSTGVFVGTGYKLAIFGPLAVTGWRYRNQSDQVVSPPTVFPFELENLDAMREAILTQTTASGPFIVNDVDLMPYSLATGMVGTTPNATLTQEGLGLKTYQSDLFNNWLSTEWIDGTNGISQITAIDTAGGSFTIDTLNLSKKVYDMLNRIAVSGGTYDDWLDSVYTDNRYSRTESPIYEGGLSKELVFQEVISNSESESGQPLGTLAGKGVMSQKHKGGKVVVKVTEPSYVIGIVSITPRVDYSQGNKWDTQLKTMDDLHKPALDEIGFQELITEQMAWWTTRKDTDADNPWTTKSAGKQPAWINYMTNVNEVRGNFAIRDNEMFMTLNRRYEWDGTSDIKDLTTYIDPSKFNNIFADTSLDAQNFWVQISVDNTARRLMSAKVMPNM